MVNILGKTEFYPKSSRFRKKIDSHLENCQECKEMFLKYRYLEMQKKAIFKNKISMPAEVENRTWEKILNEYQNEKGHARWKVDRKIPFRIIVPAFTGLIIILSVTFIYWINPPITFHHQNTALSYVPGYYMLARTTGIKKKNFLNKRKDSKIIIDEKIESLIIFSKKDFERLIFWEKSLNPESPFVRNTLSQISDLKISLADLFFEKAGIFKFRNIEVSPIGTIFQFIMEKENEVFIQDLLGRIKIKSGTNKINILQKGDIGLFRNNEKIEIKYFQKIPGNKSISWYLNRLSKRENERLISLFYKNKPKTKSAVSKKKQFKIIQNPNVRIISINGTSVVGQLIEETKNKFIIKIQQNKIEINKENVKKLDLLTSRLNIVPQPYIKLTTIDGHSIIGKLRKETKKEYIIQIQQNKLSVTKKNILRIQFLNE